MEREIRKYLKAGPFLSKAPSKKEESEQNVSTTALGKWKVNLYEMTA